jgi:hypothetical protein
MSSVSEPGIEPRPWLTVEHLVALSGIGPEPGDEDLAAHAHLRPVAWWLWLRAQGAPEGGVVRRALHALAAREAVAAARLGRLLDSLASADINAIVLKGAALAYTVYPEPWLRPRNDDDLLVAPGAFNQARQVLGRLGYDEEATNPGPEHTAQSHFAGRGDLDGHFVDLHWRPLVPAAFRQLPTYEELWRDSVPLADVAPAARAPSPAHALLLACAHRVAHHGVSEDPQWLVDVHLLSRVLDAARWDVFCRAALRSRLAEVCCFELARAVGQLGTPVPSDVLEKLGQAHGEPSARHLAAGSRLHRLWLDLGDRRGRERVTTLLARLLPPPSYMRARYGAPWPLVPFAYAWRATAGAGRWIADAAVRAGRQAGRVGKHIDRGEHAPSGPTSPADPTRPRMP